MALNITPKQLLWGLSGLSFLCLALFGGIFVYLVIFDRQAAHYPGAVPLSNHDVIKWVPRFYYRQDAAYQTNDDFPKVYNWYSSGFELGPEAQAQGQCIHMYKTETRFRVTRVMTVTLCDTPNGRMIFTQRALRWEQR